MGLDMYLYLKKDEYTSDFRGACNYPDELRSFEFRQERRNFKSVSKTTTYQIGYWRKANAIHKWFVDVCGNGEDDCREYEVRWEDLENLRDMCEEVLADHDKAEVNLPTCDGFFFGGTEYDEWYFDDLKYTKELIDDLLKFKETNKDYYITYQASW